MKVFSGRAANIGEPTPDEFEASHANLKVTLNIRSRPLPEETVEAAYDRIVRRLADLPAPFGLTEPAPRLPAMGAKLAVDVNLGGKLGKGIAARLTLRFRAPANLKDVASNDDFLVVQFSSEKVKWHHASDDALPGYAAALGAYFCRLAPSDEGDQEWNRWVRLCRETGKDLDGRDGPLRMAPLVFMDSECCKRSCGRSVSEAIALLARDVARAEPLRNGVIIAAANDYPSEVEIRQADESVRRALGALLPDQLHPARS